MLNAVRPHVPPNRLREAREAAGDSLESLALELGVDEGTVARWEASGSIPADHLRTLCERYGLPELYPIEPENDRSGGRVARSPLVAAAVGLAGAARRMHADHHRAGRAARSTPPTAPGADFINLKPGTYSGQTLPQVSGHKPTVVICQPGAKINGLEVYGDKVFFLGCDFDAPGVRPGRADRGLLRRTTSVRR